MNFNSVDNYIRCCFNQPGKGNQDDSIVLVEIFYARTGDLVSELPWLVAYIDNNERLKAEKFHFENDRNTYLTCHSLLRKVISYKLNKDPSEINIIYDGNNKPWLKSNQLFFNISHTRDTFAFAISDYVKIGIDLENINSSIDFKAIIRTYFSSGEEKYILQDHEQSMDRFFLLWTRKEALLKALGTGIIDKLKDVEVFRKENHLKKGSFNNLIDNSMLRDHYIYSMKLDNNYLSVAVPCKAKIIFHHLDINEIRNLIQDLPL